MIYRNFKLWILLSFLATAMCGLTYLAVQQSLRQGANDPQIQMAEDYAAARTTNIITGTLAPTSPKGSVDIANSLSPYFAFFDANGSSLWSTGFLVPNTSISLPRGVFSNPSLTSPGGEVRFTWQPAPGVRQAVVVKGISDGLLNVGYVMVGRSLREVEIREHQALMEAIAVWLATVVGLAIICGISLMTEKRRNR